VTTKCNHTFDKLSISLAIMKDNKCPVCRHKLELSDIKVSRKLKLELRNLKNEMYKEHASL
jgi:transcription initiation factor IIE alpha subunit